jgi:hypothetical protein
MFREHLLLYLQSDWILGGTTYKKGTLVSYDLPSFLAGTPEVKTLV